MQWYNEDQRIEMWTTLLKYKTLAVLVGHTHGASVYSFNGTAQGAFGSSAAGFIDVINAPASASASAAPSLPASSRTLL